MWDSVKFVAEELAGGLVQRYGLIRHRSDSQASEADGFWDSMIVTASSGLSCRLATMASKIHEPPRLRHHCERTSPAGSLQGDA